MRRWHFKTTEEWVHACNEKARKMDEYAASMHPSAWHELLAQDREEFQQIARSGPDDELPHCIIDDCDSEGIHQCLRCGMQVCDEHWSGVICSQCSYEVQQVVEAEVVL